VSARTRRVAAIGCSVVVLLVLSAGGVSARKAVDLILPDGEIPEELLLDVGIQVFDPGLPPEDESALEKKGIFPSVRKSEARFLAFHLKNTLESSGHWGAVRVLPEGVFSEVDMFVSGRIVESTGLKLSIWMAVEDSTGKLWIDKRYNGEADPAAYHEDGTVVGEPYQDLYDEISNDFAKVRGKMKDDAIREIRQVTRLRFADRLAPAVFGDYLRLTRKGRYKIERLPAEDDPMLARVERIRERDYLFVDTLNEYYDAFYNRMDDSYDDWREYSYEEEKALRELRREARVRKILGGIMILGGAFIDGGSSASRAARDAAVIGGVYTIGSGIEKAEESKIHRESLKELAASFDVEIAPVLIEVEGHRLRLEGSAEAQYAEWRRLLSELFESETGFGDRPRDLNEAGEEPSGL
jgi:hypothetical protein